MIVGVATETCPGEQRVALVPADVAVLKAANVDVLVQSGAGLAAGFADEEYLKNAAQLAADARDVFTRADVVLQARAAGANAKFAEAAAWLRPGQLLIGRCDALQSPTVLRELAPSQAVIFSLELLPRVPRALSMDVLTPVEMLTGHQAALLAASHLPQMFAPMMTPAGMFPAARVLVIGGGTAGLQAMVTAQRLGAQVTGYDPRPERQSLIAEHAIVNLSVDAPSGENVTALLEKIAASDAVILTANGNEVPFPVLSRETLRAMRRGSVIVDLNPRPLCELARTGEVVIEEGITLLAPRDLDQRMLRQASEMLSQNHVDFLKPLLRKGRLRLNLSDEIIASTLVTHQGQVVHSAVRQALGLSARPEPVPLDPPPDDENIFRILSD